MGEQAHGPGAGISSRIAFPCTLADARASARALREFLASEGLSDEELFAYELCLVEACNNAVQNAGEAGRDRAVFAEASCRPEAIELRVTDHTPGFSLPKQLEPPAPDSERGRGLFIIRSLMDEVSYLHGPGENTLVMRKSRIAPPAAPREPRIQPAATDLKAQLADCMRTISGMARELCFRSESLSAIFRCSAELGRTSSLDAFARRLLDDLLHLTGADWFVLRLIPPGGTDPALFAASSPEPVEPPTSAELTALGSREAARFDGGRALVHPLLFGESVVGTLGIGRRVGAEAFSSLEAEVIRTFSEFIAIQVTSLRQREEQIRNQLVTRELEIAQSIQRALLPASLPRLSGFELAGNWESARQVGGDFYDAVALGDHTLLLLVGDVMGKGVPAAMFATIMRGLVRAMASHCHDPAELLGRLNQLLYRDLSAVNMFITAALAYVDHRRRRLVLANAGHCPLVLVSTGPASVRTVRTAGLPLGVLPDVRYREEEVGLGRPCGVFLHTDGLTEARNPAGEAYGADRLLAWLRTHCQLPCAAEELRNRLSSEMQRFRGEAPMTDDQAFLILTETAPMRPASRPPRVPAESLS